MDSPALFDTGYRKPHALNLTPLIDIIFLLIVFFMVTSNFLLTQSIDLNLAAVGAPADTQSEKALLLQLAKNNRCRLEGTDIPCNTLQERLRTPLNANPSRTVVIVSEPGISIQRIVTAMEQVRLAGGTDISLAEQEK